MDIFDLRQRVVDDYSKFIKGFLKIRDPRIDQFVTQELDRGLLWPEPWISLNPSFDGGVTVTDLVSEGVLRPDCERIFRIKSPEDPVGRTLALHRHQRDALDAAQSGDNYVLTTGTGSGKSLAYILPIVDEVLRMKAAGAGANQIKAIIVYPMNALANSQDNELKKFLTLGFGAGNELVTFRRYTGQEDEEQRQEVLANPPDILLTNYVMAELILTRVHEQGLIQAARGLRFLVLDELHTYRGRQGADVAFLIRRIKEACKAHDLQVIGTSATLASGNSFAEQQREIADVASRLFGAPVIPDRVIGETLRRVTVEPVLDDPGYVEKLAQRVIDSEAPATFDELRVDPLAAWVETTFGLATNDEGRLVRATPRTITGEGGAAAELAELTGCTEEAAAAAIRRMLLAGYAVNDPATNRPVFAFRLHQFVTRGDTVYAALGAPDMRHVTMQAQTFDPTDPLGRNVLLPLVFCRECGQEYYSVAIRAAAGDTPASVTARRLGDQDPDDGAAAFLYVAPDAPWPVDRDDMVDRVPDDWVEETSSGRTVRSDRRDWLPVAVGVHADGRLDLAGENGSLLAHRIPVPFRFCLRCGVSYSFTTRSDISKLTTVGLEGRSTATTMLSLSILRFLREQGSEAGLPDKLLTFTDNRQDASLQAGHFNDFVQVSQLRAALHNAVADAGDDGLTHERLPAAVFDALGLDFGDYALDPTLILGGRDDTNRALREVLAYRLYTDLRRGWRVTAPNLEQTGQLCIEYRSLNELCEGPYWDDAHPALAAATPNQREAVARTLLDYMRRELAVSVDYLNPAAQEQLIQRSNQQLRAPWGLDENEQTRLERAAVLMPRSKRRGDDPGLVYVSERSNFARWLRKKALPDAQLNVAETADVIKSLLERLQKAQLVVVAREPAVDDVPGYQVPASALIWKASTGTSAAWDPIRVPNLPDGEELRTNAFFVDFYAHVAAELRGMTAREHTAQVPNDEREKREKDFREGKLPLLFCSPTMELGIDIADLNVVGMRNVPPSPANYAQRSGRAGRSGQPALVVTYCSTGSSHDQYFFRRPKLMVSGQVSPPRLDLTNEDLIRAHVHAIWLAETRCDLGSSLKDILDVAGDNPTLTLLPSKAAQLHDPAATTRATQRANAVLAGIHAELNDTDWWSPAWLPDVLHKAPQAFEDACDRWRTLYRAAQTQRAIQNSIIGDASRPQRDKDQARRLRAEAEAQLGLLTNDSVARYQSDFYSYRYFASEGFLPGYNFPRLPLSAFIPARRRGNSSDDFLSRPRFLAISEFGPRSFVYHEGSRYVINRVILPVADASDEGQPIRTVTAKRCGECGYMHRLTGDAINTCRACATPFDTDATLVNLFRMQNVSARRTERISSDEEERSRRGYDLRTGVEFAETNGRLAVRRATVTNGNEQLADLTYGERTTLWRLNLGWSRRDAAAAPGFRLDIERGYWQKANDDHDPDDPLGPRVETVIPYVEDRRNALLVRLPVLAEGDDRSRLALAAGLKAALSNAIQVLFNLEDSELAAEILPSRDDPRQLLIYEASEGGAGVLRRLADSPAEFARVARQALEICHYSFDATGDLVDHRHAPGATEDCVAACYDCLMSYGNQPDHPILDRRLIASLLTDLAGATTLTSPTEATRDEHLRRLVQLSGSTLEQRFLEHLDSSGLRLPDDAQVLIPEAHTKPDFVYREQRVAVYVDGPSHEFPDRAARDALQTADMEDLGWTVLRFAANDDWDHVINDNRSTFGTPA